MRSACSAFVVSLWMTGACGEERGPAPPPASTHEVVPAKDTVATGAVLVTRDTMVVHSGIASAAGTGTHPAATEPWAIPNDCRYADRRPRVRPGQPGYGGRYDSAAIANGVTYRCRLRPEEPEVRLVVLGEGSIPMAVRVFSPPDAAGALQVLTLDNDQPAYEGSELLVGEDLNGDGWMDLRVHTWYGSGGQMSGVFRFDAAARRFIPDSVLPGMNVHRLPEHGCVGTGWKAGAWDYTSAKWCWSRGAWVHVRDFEQKWLGGERRVIRTLRERRGGRMQVVRLDTLPDDAPDW